MHANVGDRIVINGHRIGEPDRDCEVIEVGDAKGGPPFVVRWGDSGHQTLSFPRPNAAVEHYEHTSA